MKLRNLCLILLALGMFTVQSSVAQVINGAVGAEPRESYIVLRWYTLDETGVEKFQVLRREASHGDYALVAEVPKKGSGSTYEYIDRSVFKSNGRVFQYIVRVLGPGNVVAEERQTSVLYGLSSTARRTWGSIKSMFR